MVTEMSSEKMRKLIQDYQRDIAAYLAPESGISERQLLQQLASRLDGQQAQDALGNGWQGWLPDDEDPAAADDGSPAPTRWWTEPEFFGTMWKLRS
ncbi:hypothetical protein CDO30_20565 (plasmid) [Sinorhizobium meliloti]|uniref:Uncharacterized protein n=3 Tax=Sinorhizobium TaxID=28105 RepID=Q930G1_RHIME|nr:hypothetical protein SMa0450 [Sinorhizobium meliloti 1021]AGG69928.1 Hypothetical protein SM2011_a0450 [Sinorhizobium meliloti 2011]ASP60665.1 hypothetical protein CDO30_20565 [Sinorhizobium meliloti]MDW9610834.1 hypothetical protein [Sinorhizobium meliloti]MDW9835974.1 hypothetical protein [Sinorhizobium meliloti]